ncbi:E3 ubiquitin-protein ligase synoviolin, partial [Parus major]|uniref:E3 ubiquitin-protein ligase synoviolin n=1 Tax=Parus major TaxID=9157 RepID=UPI001443FF53
MLCTALVMAGSLALTTAVVAHAYYLKHQFYPTVVYLTKSSPSMAVLYIQAFVLVFLLGKFMGKVFFGQLRAAEMEHLLERSWYAVTETCLAFTVFRDDFSPRFVALFTLLLFLKCFHWLAEDRVDFVSVGSRENSSKTSPKPPKTNPKITQNLPETSPKITWLIKVLLYMAFMTIMIKVHTFPLFAIRPMYLAMSGAAGAGCPTQRCCRPQYAILMTMVLTIFIKYVLHSIDLQNDNPWDNKAVFMLYTELFTGSGAPGGAGGVVLVVFNWSWLGNEDSKSWWAQLVFTGQRRLKVLVVFNWFWLVNQNSKSWILGPAVAVADIPEVSRRRYPDATAEELQAVDNVCIICREEMVTGAKRLPCNHIFHTSCLRSWFQRQQTCPTCRMDVLRASLPAQPPPEPPAPAPPPPGPQPPHLPQGILPPFPPGMFPFWPPVGPFPPVPGVQAPAGTD